MNINNLQKLLSPDKRLWLKYATNLLKFSLFGISFND